MFNKVRLILLIIIFFILLLFNGIVLFNINIPKAIPAVINIIGTAFILVVLSVFYRSLKGIDNREIQNNKKNESQQTLINEYQSLSVEFITMIKNVMELFNKIMPANQADFSETGKEADNANKLRDFIDLLNKRLNSDDVKLYFEKIKSLGIITEVYYKIPYLVKFLKKVIEKTEAATTTLIDKFDIVLQEHNNATNEAMNNLNSFKQNEEGRSFEETIEISKKAISGYREMIDNLAKVNLDNFKSLEDIEDKINVINQTLNNIVEISNQNKIIHINLSIEAVQLGEKGKGVMVIVNEIKKLNQKTAEFILQINSIMKSFKDYNEKVIGRLSNEKDNMTKNIETTSRQSENIVNSLIVSYESTANLFIKLTNSNLKVRQSMDNVIESLQFQDITRQQIENVIDFLGEIRNRIKESESLLQYFNIKLGEEDEEIHEKIYKEFGQKAKVFDEKLILESIKLINSKVL